MFDRESVQGEPDTTPSQTDSEKTSIFVTVRIRPFSERELLESDEPCVRFDPSNPNTISLETHSSADSKIFCFDYIAHQSTSQIDVFTRVALPAADSCLEGYNGCIFAYGQTGAGKTFTITGASTIEAVINSENRGMLPRVLDYIFTKIRSTQQQPASSSSDKVVYLIKCSYLEIYNEHIIDLLADRGENLQLREDVKKGVFVENLTEMETSTFQEAVEILKTGGRNRHNGATSMNRESSRSHSVFSITLQSKNQSDGVTHIKYSRFHFVDLAGSERIKQTNAVGDRLKEGCNINKSLSILGNVINALVDVDNGRARHIHYRDSKLTFLLKDSLGGNSKTRLIANVSPASSAFQETLSTLKFAKRAKLIKNKVQINEDHSGNLDALNNEIKKLRMENIQNVMKKKQAEDENSRMKESEELCQHYLEQASEMEMKMNYNFGKTKDQLVHLTKYVQKFQSNEFQYRSIIMLQRARIERMEAFLESNKTCDQQTFEAFFSDDREATKKEVKGLKELLSNQMYCTKLFTENIELKAKVEKVQEPGRSIYELLTNNFDVLKGIQHKLERNVEQRVRLHKIIEEIDENPAVETAKKAKVESQIQAIEATHKQEIQVMVAEIAKFKDRLSESESTAERLGEVNGELEREVEQMKQIVELKQVQHEENIQELKRVVEATSCQSDERISTIQVRNIELSESVSRLQEQNLVLHEEIKEVDRLRAEKKSVTDKTVKQQEEITTLESSIKELTKNYEKREDDFKRVVSESMHQCERIRYLEDLLEEANVSKHTAEKRRVQIEKKLSELEERFADFESISQNKQLELEEEIETLTETLAFRQSELDEIRSRQRSERKSQIGSAGRQQDSSLLQVEDTDLQALRSSGRLVVSEFNSVQVTQLESRIAELTQELSEVQQKHVLAMSEMEQVHQSDVEERRVVALKEKEEEIELFRKESLAEISVIQESLIEKQVMVKRLECEAEETKTRLLKANNDMYDKEEELKRLMVSFQEAMALNEKKEQQERKKYESGDIEVKKEIASLKEQLKKSETEREQVYNEIQLLQEKNAKLTEQILAGSQAMQKRVEEIESAKQVMQVQLQEELEEQNAILSALRAEKGNAVEQVDTLLVELEEQKARAAQVESSYNLQISEMEKTVKERIESAEKDMSGEQERLLAAQKQIADERIEQLEQAMETLSRAIEQRDVMIVEREKAIRCTGDEKSAEIRLVMQQLDEQRERESAMSAYVARLEKDISQKDEQLSVQTRELSRQLQTIQETKRNSEEELAAASEKVSAMSEQIVVVQNQLGEQQLNYEQEVSRIHEQVEQLREEMRLKEIEMKQRDKAIADGKLKLQKEKVEKSNQIEELKESMGEQSGQLEQANVELIRLREQLENSRVECDEKLRQRESELKREHESSVEQSRRVAQELQSSLAVSAKRIELLEGDKVNAKQVLEAQKATHAQVFAAHVDSLTAEKKALNVQVNAMQQQLSQRDEEIARLSSKIKQSGQVITKNEKELLQKKEIITTLNEEYSKLIAQNEVLKSSVSESTAKSEKLSGVVAQMEKDVERAQKSFSASIEEQENRHNEELNKIFDERRLMLEQLESTRTQKDSEIEVLCGQYIDEIENFKKLTKNLQNQTEFLERENIEKEELNAQLLAKLNEFKDELGKRDEFVFEKVHEDHEKLHQLNRALDAKTKMIEESKANLLQAKKDMQEMKKLLDFKNREIEAQKNELKDFYQKTQLFAQNRDAELKDVKEHHAKLLEEHNKIMLEVESLQKQTEDLSMERAHLTQDNRKLAASEKKLKSQLGEMIEVGKNLNEDKNQLLRELDEANAQLAFLGGHNNPDQKIKMFNKMKEENTALKNEKRELQESNRLLLAQAANYDNAKSSNPLKNLGNLPLNENNGRADNESKETQQLREIILNANQMMQQSMKGLHSSKLSVVGKSANEQNLCLNIKQLLQELQEKDAKIRDFEKKSMISQNMKEQLLNITKPKERQSSVGPIGGSSNSNNTSNNGVVLGQQIQTYSSYLVPPSKLPLAPSVGSASYLNGQEKDPLILSNANQHSDGYRLHSRLNSQDNHHGHIKVNANPLLVGKLSSVGMSNNNNNSNSTQISGRFHSSSHHEKQPVIKPYSHN